MGMCLVIYQFEIPEPEAEDVADIGVDPHFGEGQGLPGKLQFYLFQVVGVDVYVAAGPHEIAGPVTGDLRHHQGEQGIGSYVKGHSQENVATALVELAGEFSSGNVKLEKKVAGRKVHLMKVADIPGADDMPAGIGILLQGAHHFADLVNVPAVGGFPVTPLRSVNWPQVARFIGPFIPYADSVFLQIFYVGIPFQKP